MRIGLSTPVVVQLPGVFSPWEATAGPEELARVAEVADELGYDHLTCSEHVGLPVDVAEQRGATYWDPVATLSFLAARTRRIRLATSVLVLGYHHPLQVAKTYGTLDVLSHGRLVLGVGVGSLEEEFDLLGASWAGRGAHADDTLRALRAALGRREPAYDGSHHSFGGFVVEPHAVQTEVPLWVGGKGLKSLQRAVELADGWMPFGLPAAALGEIIAQVDLPEGFDIVLGPGPLDPTGDPDKARRRLEALRDVGATAVTVALRAESVDHYCEQLAAAKAIADTL